MASVVLFQDNTSPSVTDVITVNGVAEDLTGATVSFQARDPRNGTLIIDNTADVTLANQTTTPGGIQWDPQASETATAYVSPPLVAWWHIELSSGAVQDSPEFALYILPHDQTATSDLCTLSDFREISEVNISDRGRDELVQNLIPVASAVINDYCRRELGYSGTATRRFNVMGSIVDLDPYDLQSVGTATLNPETSTPQTLTATTDYILQPVGAPQGAYQYLELNPVSAVSWSSTRAYYGYGFIDITGVWGMGTVPPAVRMACVRTVESWLDRAQANYGPADLLDEPRGVLPQFDSAYGVPPGARMLLRPYKRCTPLPR